MFPLANIQSNETQNIDNLLNQRDEELKRVFQIRLVIDALREMPVGDLNVNDTKQLELAQKLLNVSEYLELQDGNNLLDLKPRAQLAYVESKAVKEYLFATLTKSLKEKAAFKMHLSSSSGPRQELLALEAERRMEIQKVVTLQNQKCALLKQLLDGYVKSNMHFEVEKILEESRLEAEKTQVLHKYMLNEFASRSEDFKKALKIVKNNMDEMMEETKEELNK